MDMNDSSSPQAEMAQGYGGLVHVEVK